MTEHPLLRRWITEYCVRLTADGTRLRFKVRPPADVEEVFKAQKDIAISVLKGEAPAPEAKPEPEAEPVEPSPPVVGAESAPEGPTRTGPTPRPAPTTDDWYAGDAISVQGPDGAWVLQWRDEKATTEMLLQLKRQH